MFKNRNIYLKDSIKKVYPSVVMLKQIKGVLGSGFIYKIKDEYAYILTNYHVVNGSYEYKTTIYNGETLVSKLVGKDYDNDIAVLRTDASKVSSIVKLGNSENLEVGDDVFAIGSPLNPDYIGTVTKGIVKEYMEDLLDYTDRSSYWWRRSIRNCSRILSCKSRI